VRSRLEQNPTFAGMRTRYPRIIVKTVLPVFCYLVAIACNAQDHGFFQQLWQEEGLSQSTVSSIVQDEQGFIWIGTQDGLNRYDGKHVDKFNTQPFNIHSLSGSTITSVCTQNGKLWVLCTDGLDLFDLNTLQANRISKLVKGIKSERWSIIRTWVLNDRIFVFTQDGFSELKEKGKNEYVLETYGIKRRFNDNRLLGMLSAVTDDKKNLFLGTSEGIYTCKAGSTVFEPFDIHNKTGKETESFTDRCSSLLYKQNKLYFSRGHIFYEYDIATNKLCCFSAGTQPNGTITCAITDNQNKFWLGTNGNGLFRVAKDNKGEFTAEKHFKDNVQDKYGLKSNFISYLFQGSHPNEDVVWIGSTDAGAFSYSYSKNSFELISSRIDNPKENFFSLTKDRDNIIWSATRSGIYRIDRSGNNYSFMDISALLPKNSFSVITLHYDDNNNLWVGAANTLFTIDKRNNGLKKVSGPLLPSEGINNVLKIAGHGDTLLLGTGHGLVLYCKSTGKTAPLCSVMVGKKVMKIPRVETLFVDSKKNWWICTAAGVILVDKQYGKNRLYSHNPSDKNSLLANDVMDIRETREGDILLATGNGLSVIKDPQHGEKIENYSSYPGLTNNFIYGIVPDQKGNFWLSTNYGISVFNPEKKIFKSYHASDGTYINEFNSYSHYAAEDGELLFGGIGGLIGVYPEKLIKDAVTPNPVLRTFKINQHNADSLLVHSPGSLDLDHDQNSFYLEFSIPYFSGLSKYKLLYLLEGGREQWTEVGESNSFSLANLAPGSYFLKVKIVNEDGIESLQPFTLSIRINTPFWKSTWFLLIILALCFLLIRSLYQYRIHTRLALIKKMDSIRLEENEKVRKAAALDLHDEFGNGLTRISMLVETLRLKIPKENPEILKTLDIITTNCSRMYQGTKDFIWSIHPGNDNLYEVIIRLKDFGDELFYGTGISFELYGLKEEFKKLNHLPGTGRNVTMIFKEALSNILKHAKADKVSLSVMKDGAVVNIRLQDNGKGFDPDKNKNGFGISNMQHRAGKAAVLLTISSESSAGSSITATMDYGIQPDPSVRTNPSGKGQEPTVPPFRSTGSATGLQEGINATKELEEHG